MVKILLISISFLIINITYFLINVPKILYPITASVFFLFFIYIYIISIQKQEELVTEEVNNNLIQNLPKKRLLNELKMARRVQQGLLLVESPNIDGINIAKKCIPADNIGGDFFSFICKDFEKMSPHHRSPGIVKYIQSEDKYLGIVIGDVAGHGVSSALIMALSAGLFSEIGKRYSSPKKVLEEANKDLMRYIENSQITHITAFYGILNLNTFEFHYCRAGHPYPLLLKNDNTILELNSNGALLGMFKNTVFEEKSIQLEKKDRLFFYTDGITEAKGPNGDLFGQPRLKDSIIKFKLDPIGTVIHQLFEDVELYTQYQKASDDRSVVILELS